MIPLRDTIQSRSTPWVTRALIVANVVAFGYELSLPTEALDRLFATFGIVPAAVTAGAVPLPWILRPFLGSLFLHGGLFHLLANMWTLWIFGDNVEDRLGSGRFLLFYLASGLSAGAVHLVTNPGSAVPTIGASGAIAGVLGAYFVLYPFARIVTLIPIVFWPVFVELPAFLYLGFWFVSQLASGGASAAAGTAGGIAWWAHVGGFLAGLILLRAFGGPLRRDSSVDLSQVN